MAGYCAQLPVPRQVELQQGGQALVDQGEGPGLEGGGGQAEAAQPRAAGQGLGGDGAKGIAWWGMRGKVGVGSARTTRFTPPQLSLSSSALS